MEIDAEKVDGAALALLFLTLHDEPRASKGFDWDALDRLHRKGMLADPAGKAKSVILTDEGLQRSRDLYEALFAKERAPAARPASSRRRLPDRASTRPRPRPRRVP